MSEKSKEALLRDQVDEEQLEEVTGGFEPRHFPRNQEDYEGVCMDKNVQAAIKGIRISS